MKNIEQIKKELIVFGKKHNACEKGLEAIKGNNFTELFSNINKYIDWCKATPEITKEFNAIFENKLVIEDNVLLCNCTNLSSVVIPNSVTLIREHAFECCTELTSVIIPNSIKSIGDYAFRFCIALKSVVIPNSVTLIRDLAFSQWRDFTSTTIHNATSISDYAFYGCREDLKIIRK
jgi:hypothetical protein